MFFFTPTCARRFREAIWIILQDCENWQNDLCKLQSLYENLVVFLFFLFFSCILFYWQRTTKQKHQNIFLVAVIDQYFMNVVVLSFHDITPIRRHWQLWRLWNGHPEYHRRHDLYDRNRRSKLRHFPNENKKTPKCYQQNNERAQWAYFNVIKTTITWNESSDFFAIFDQLNSDAFTNSGVWLFSFDTPK